MKTRKPLTSVRTGFFHFNSSSETLHAGRSFSARRVTRAGIALAFGMAALFATVPAQAQLAPEDVEALAGPGTFLDLTDDIAGTTRNGIMMTWDNFAAGSWNFPDSSNSGEFVNGNSADDKESAGGTDPIQLSFSGLAPSTEYNISLGVLSRPAGNDEGGDISWGTASDSLTTVNFDTDNVPAGSVVIDTGTTLALVRVGSLSSDASGLLTLFVGEGLPFQPDPIRNRTQFDGVFVSVVPEPTTLALLGLGGLGALFLRRSRQA